MQKKGRAVHVVDGEPAGSLGRPRASGLPYIDDLKTVARTLEPEGKPSDFPATRTWTDAARRAREVVCLNGKARDEPAEAGVCGQGMQ